MAAPPTAATVQLRDQLRQNLEKWKIIKFSFSHSRWYYWNSQISFGVGDEIITKMINDIVAEWETKDITDMCQFENTKKMTTEQVDEMVDERVDTYLCEFFLVSHLTRTVLN
ncbi:hypothetical protein L211DRAFT_851589 [Terfezia boudieri ATCC MYA-4762]|uniref:Uncharacterized protein n=1 Tax=Terfezia boudieri ATCC MYA-4762 TaxID=1051890 RepID=A0A3N4LE94_9PEZI|nr:hypothetical protein L211DRAFT_851589 [Terfezia boudieri ATCC MYA-4762]